MNTYKDKSIKYKKKYIELKYRMKGGTISCPVCTFINKDGIQNCEMCGADLKQKQDFPGKKLIDEFLKEKNENNDVAKVQFRNLIHDTLNPKMERKGLLEYINTKLGPEYEKIYDSVLEDFIKEESKKDAKTKPKHQREEKKSTIVEDIKTIKDTLPTQMTNNWNEYDEKALQNLINHKEKLKKAIDKSEVIGFNGLQYFVMTNVVFDSKIIIDSPFPTDGKQKEASNLKEALILLGFEIAGKDDSNIRILTQFHGLESEHRKVEGITGHGGINHEYLLAVFNKLVDKLKEVDNGILVNREEIQKLLGK